MSVTFDCTEAGSAMYSGCILNESWDSSVQAWSVSLADHEGSQVASANLGPAEADHGFDGYPEAQLKFACSVRHVKVRKDFAAALAYALARRARILDRVHLVFADGDSLLTETIRCTGKNFGLSSQRTDLAAHYSSLVLEQAGTPILSDLRESEIRESAETWLASGNDWGFFRAVLNGTLTRAQYVYALSNIYQFVRHTTRLASRAVSHSPTTEMRSHFISHLNGEVNHELLIERDLEHLGEDVDFVRSHMAPNGPTQEFMVVQESLIGYYQDPVLLLASPVAAEGVTGHLDQAFIDALHGCLRSWGVESPAKACRFLTSHMHTDGGDDGHWEMTIKFAGKCLVDETKHLFFIRSMRNAMRSTTRLYESFVEEVPGHTVPNQQSTAGSRNLRTHA